MNNRKSCFVPVPSSKNSRKQSTNSQDNAICKSNNAAFTTPRNALLAGSSLNKQSVTPIITEDNKNEDLNNNNNVNNRINNASFNYFESEISPFSNFYSNYNINFLQFNNNSLNASINNNRKNLINSYASPTYNKFIMHNEGNNFSSNHNYGMSMSPLPNPSSSYVLNNINYHIHNNSTGHYCDYESNPDNAKNNSSQILNKNLNQITDSNKEININNTEISNSNCKTVTNDFITLKKNTSFNNSMLINASGPYNSSLNSNITVKKLDFDVKKEHNHKKMIASSNNQGSNFTLKKQDIVSNSEINQFEITIDGKNDVVKYEKNEMLVNKIFKIKDENIHNNSHNLLNINNNTSSGGNNININDNSNVLINNNYIKNYYIVNNINILNNKFNTGKYEFDIDNYNNNLYSQDSLETEENHKTSNPVIKTQPCNCQKSKCLKLYCECFSNGRYCENCNCKDCNNIKEYEPERSSIIKKIKNKNESIFNSSKNISNFKGCKCSKSNCRKKYCECFQKNIECTINCKCTGCKNCSKNVVKKDLLTSSSDNEIKTKECDANNTDNNGNFQIKINNNNNNSNLLSNTSLIKDFQKDSTTSCSDKLTGIKREKIIPSISSYKNVALFSTIKKENNDSLNNSYLSNLNNKKILI